MTSIARTAFRLAATTALACSVVACGAAQLDGGGSSNSGTTNATVTTTPQAAPYLTPWPERGIAPDAVFVVADGAFQAGDMVTAHREFGVLYILAPGYGGGIPSSALTQTCANLNLDCAANMARLDFMGEAWRDTFGPRAGWHPQQEQDYEAIRTCFDRTLTGDFQSAIAAATPVTTAPFEPFRMRAIQCLESANAGLAEQRRREEADRALVAFYDNFPCFEERLGPLVQASGAEDWDAFVAMLPAFETCAGPIRQIIDDGILEGDERVGFDHDYAWSELSSLDTILMDNGAVIEATRQNTVTLRSNPMYQQYRVEFDQLAFEEQRLLNQIAPIEQAAATLEGPARQPIDAQIASMMAEVEAVRARMAEVMAGINGLRAELGMAPRQYPAP